MRKLVMDMTFDLFNDILELRNINELSFRHPKCIEFDDG
jgi:hypothetical protein